MYASEVVALGYEYPTPDRIEELRHGIEMSLRGVCQKRMSEFVDEVGALSLAEWEELHTVTLDLSPQFVPYVGHVEWGENYRRGAFMADLNRLMAEAGVDKHGELPDHLAPVLRYLAASPAPLQDLVEVLPGAVASMQKMLHKAAPDNPYVYLLAATAAVVEDLNVVTIGGRP